MGKQRREKEGILLSHPRHIPDERDLRWAVHALPKRRSDPFRAGERRRTGVGVEVGVGVDGRDSSCIR